MTTNDKVEALIAAAQDLANRAVSDDALAERLLTNTRETIAEAAGHPIPGGILLTAQRDADGAIEITAQADPQFEGELDDAALDGVAGGRDMMPAMAEAVRVIAPAKRKADTRAAMA